MFLNFHTPAFQLRCPFLDLLDTLCGICSSLSRYLVTKLLHLVAQLLYFPLRIILCYFKCGDPGFGFDYLHFEIVIEVTETLLKRDHASLKNSCNTDIRMAASTPGVLSLLLSDMLPVLGFCERRYVSRKKAGSLECRITYRRWKRTAVGCSLAS
ncbi:hypothetical protein BDZ45DRAFT_182593 [Acephala macrosclerotiorum]|nr:hypothetical protein BDZ45DRAFT_182593 [Acephala macrosclerotiorum]